MNIIFEIIILFLTGIIIKFHIDNISNMSNLTFPSSNTVIQEIQSDKKQIEQLREQSNILYMLNQKVARKDNQIATLQKKIQQYKPYYDDYEAMQAAISTKNIELDRIKQQNSILYKQVEKVVQENKNMQEKLMNAERLKHEYIKQRNSSDKKIRDIQEIFEEYQQSCKNKEKQLLLDLEKAYKKINELDHQIDRLKKIQDENDELKSKINLSLKPESLHPTHFNSKKTGPEFINMSLQYPVTGNEEASRIYGSNSIQLSGNRSNKKNSKSREIDLTNEHLNHEIENIRKQLHMKEQQLQRAKALSHQLSIEFDKSVSKICEFEKQLSAYRKQNHQLKKTLSLFVERQQYEKMHRNKVGGKVDSSGDSDQYQQDNIGYSQFGSSERG